jgi:hypothetical protein
MLRARVPAPIAVDVPEVPGLAGEDGAATASADRLAGVHEAGVASSQSLGRRAVATLIARLRGPALTLLETRPGDRAVRKTPRQASANGERNLAVRLPEAVRASCDHDRIRPRLRYA